MTTFLVPRGQEFGVLEFLEFWGRDAADPYAFLHYEDLPDRPSLPAGTYVFCSLDQLTPAGLGIARELEAQLRSSGSGVRVLNSVDRTLGRLELLETLHRRGLNQHGAARATADLRGLRFPVFLREEHQHKGPISPLLPDPMALEVELARSVVRGYPLNETLVVEYCDTADDAGIYRKYSTFVIGSAIIPQFMSYGHEWMLHVGDTEFDSAMIREEWNWVRENPHDAELRPIFELAGVEYGRIDYAMKDGRIETWEINLNPTLARYPMLSPEQERLRRPTIEHFHRRFHDAFEMLDGGAPERSVAIRYSPESLRSRGAMIRRGHTPRFPAALVRAARPVRPLVDWIIRSLSPVLLRMAGRRDTE